jgi:hypothetical protein
MAKNSEIKRSILVGTRVSPAEHRKLLDMARQTHRTSADLLRLLITKAVLPEPPAIVVGAEEPTDGL